VELYIELPTRRTRDRKDVAGKALRNLRRVIELWIV